MSDADRQALRARQGIGARHDAAESPHADLLLARRGVAYFARLLNALPDAGLAGPSRREGKTRAYLVAEVSYRARDLAEALERLRTGASDGAPEDRAAFGATLPPCALRSLFQHATVHLNVEWRDLNAEGWREAVNLLPHGRIASIDTPRLMAGVFWRGAVDLGCGGSLRDLPAELATS